MNSEQAEQLAENHFQKQYNAPRLVAMDTSTTLDALLWDFDITTDVFAPDNWKIFKAKVDAVHSSQYNLTILGVIKILRSYAVPPCDILKIATEQIWYKSELFLDFVIQELYDLVDPKGADETIYEEILMRPAWRSAIFFEPDTPEGLLNLCVDHLVARIKGEMPPQCCPCVDCVS